MYCAFNFRQLFILMSCWLSIAQDINRYEKINLLNLGEIKPWHTGVIQLKTGIVSSMHLILQGKTRSVSLH